MNKTTSNDLKDYPHVDLLFPSDYITAADLRGRDVTVVIEQIEPRHELRRQSGKDHKPVVRLKGAAKAWVLNKTNARIIAKLYGPEVQNWIGKPVILYPAKVQFGREQVDAIRVRPTAPRGQQPRSTERNEPSYEPSYEEREAAEAERHFAEREPGGEG